MDIRIVDAEALPAEGWQQMGAVLLAAFANNWPESWRTQEDADEELAEFRAATDRICRVAVDEVGRVLGWIGGIPDYDGHVWELHPLAVDPQFQRQGIGRLLVMDFEEHVRARGGLLIMLGSDDEDNMTSLGGEDLFPNPLHKLLEIVDVKGHPFTFYRKLGYDFIGVIPDANGFGKPDILMGKRVGS